MSPQVCTCPTSHAGSAAYLAPCVFRVHEFMSIRIFNVIPRLAGCVAQPVKHRQKQKTKKSEDQYTVTSHVILRNFGVVDFWCFLFSFCFFRLFLWFCFFGFCWCVWFFVWFWCFLVFLVFGQGGRCKGKSSIAGHFRKCSEAIENFGKFREQNLSESLCFYDLFLSLVVVAAVVLTLNFLNYSK